MHANPHPRCRNNYPAIWVSFEMPARVVFGWLAFIATPTPPPSNIFERHEKGEKKRSIETRKEDTQNLTDAERFDWK